MVVLTSDYYKSHIFLKSCYRYQSNSSINCQFVRIFYSVPIVEYCYLCYMTDSIFCLSGSPLAVISLLASPVQHGTGICNLQVSAGSSLMQLLAIANTVFVYVSCVFFLLKLSISLFYVKTPTQ